MTNTELAHLLIQLGCPPGKAQEMASQLDKRAHQLSTRKGRSYDEAMAHLLKLMSQGWVAQGKNAQ
jgi:hypothetical protein